MGKKKTYRFLESSDFSESHCARSEPVRFLDSATLVGVSTLACGLVGELLSWGLGSSVFSCCLLGTCHGARFSIECKIRLEESDYFRR